MTEAKRIVMSTYLPTAMADEVRRLAKRDNVPASAWIETAIKHRIILEGKWTKEYDLPRQPSGRKPRYSLLDNVTKEKPLDSELSDCETSDKVVKGTRW